MIRAATAVASILFAAGVGLAAAADNPPAIAPSAPVSGQVAGDTAPAQPANLPSLMLTADEIKAVEKALADRDKPAVDETAKNLAIVQAAEQGRAKPRVPNIYVSAVLDFGGGDWTVWANGMRVTPERQPPLFKVASVSGNTVEIVVPEEGNVHLKLQPHQTWRSREGDVVEGIFP